MILGPCQEIGGKRQSRQKKDNSRAERIGDDAAAVEGGAQDVILGPCQEIGDKARRKKIVARSGIRPLPGNRSEKRSRRGKKRRVKM